MIRLSHAVCKRYFKLVQRTHFCYGSNLLNDLECTHSHFDFHFFFHSDVCAFIKRYTYTYLLEYLFAKKDRKKQLKVIEILILALEELYCQRYIDICI